MCTSTEMPKAQSLMSLPHSAPRRRSDRRSGTQSNTFLKTTDPDGKCQTTSQTPSWISRSSSSQISGFHMELIIQFCVPGCSLIYILLGLDPPHPSLPVGRGSCDTKQGSAALRLGLQNSTPWEPSPQVFVSHFAHMTVDQGRQVQSSCHNKERHG